MTLSVILLLQDWCDRPQCRFFDACLMPASSAGLEVIGFGQVDRLDISQPLLRLAVGATDVIAFSGPVVYTELFGL